MQDSEFFWNGLPTILKSEGVFLAVRLFVKGREPALERSMTFKCEQLSQATF